MNSTQWIAALTQELKAEHQTTINEATVPQLHSALSEIVMARIADQWYESRHRHDQVRRAYYFSAEYLVGRMVYNNLYVLDILDEVKEAFSQAALDLACLEDIEDAALGNGGLGRLAACFLDSAATHDLPLDGYGIRYKYGLFKQSFRDGWQVETADDWQRQGDPWSIRRDVHGVNVVFAGQTVRAVPYDMPILGYKTNNIGTLRLWQAEPLEEFDFVAFNDQKYAKAVQEKNAVEDITRVLYPNDSTIEGKKLRLKQQYFLSSASLQDILYKFRRAHGREYKNLAEHVAIQLNDTHPTVSIPELTRLLMADGMDFDRAFDIVNNVFSYTNHTIMAEALEKWDVELFRSVLPEVFDIIYRINARFCGELMQKGYQRIGDVSIIQGQYIHMANLAVYGGRTTNGVAAIHSELIKTTILRDFYGLFPERFQNKTNGVTQRHWLGLCNPELSDYIVKRIGENWLLDLTEIGGLKKHLTDQDVREFNAVKQEKKRQLSEFIEKSEGVTLPPEFLFDVQVKRMHEYKRQLLNALSIVDIYFRLKAGELPDFTPSCYIFGAKAAPGYIRAKTVIKFINDLAGVINNDPDVSGRLRVVFVSNYNLSYAERIIPAADVSEQISPAGTEASGTGNMKLMMNGAVTLGTLDGATVEIVQEAGAVNNYIFGKTVEELRSIAGSYDPWMIYKTEPRVRRALDTLVNGSLFPTEPAYRDLYDSLLSGASWHKADHYYVVLELLEYIERKLDTNRDYRDRLAFGRKCLINVACAGKFSSDRTVKQYADEIWHIEKLNEGGGGHGQAEGL